MSNEKQLDDLEKMNDIKDISEAKKDEEPEEDIMDKINKQIEFLKNKFEVAKIVDCPEKEDEKIDRDNNQSNKNIFQDEINNETIKGIKDEK